jgi:hypothetical protein
MAPRSLLAALVVAATVAFVVGTALERSAGESSAAPAAEAGEAHGEGAGEAATHAEGEAESQAASGGERSELRPLGVDLEAAPVVALAAVASLALALPAWLRPRAATLLAIVAAAMFAFAALDAREVLHQLDEHRTALVLLAATVAALHAAAAAVAGRMAR